MYCCQFFFHSSLSLYKIIELVLVINMHRIFEVVKQLIINQSINWSINFIYFSSAGYLYFTSFRFPWQPLDTTYITIKLMRSTCRCTLLAGRGKKFLFYNVSLIWLGEWIDNRCHQGEHADQYDTKANMLTIMPPSWSWKLIAYNLLCMKLSYIINENL